VGTRVAKKVDVLEENLSRCMVVVLQFGKASHSVFQHG
jgi:hypothetical protein